jgi:hypothetical protein
VALLLRSAEIQPVFQRFVLLCLRITPLLPLSLLNYMAPVGSGSYQVPPLHLTAYSCMHNPQATTPQSTDPQTTPLLLLSLPNYMAPVGSGCYEVPPLQLYKSADNLHPPLQFYKPMHTQNWRTICPQLRPTIGPQLRPTIGPQLRPTIGPQLRPTIGPIAATLCTCLLTHSGHHCFKPSGHS